MCRKSHEPFRVLDLDEKLELVKFVKADCRDEVFCFSEICMRSPRSLRYDILLGRVWPFRKVPPLADSVRHRSVQIYAPEISR